MGIYVKFTMTTHQIQVCAHTKFWEVSGSEDRGGGDNSIQIINFGRVGDKSFEEWRQKVEGWKGGWHQNFDFFVLMY